MGVEEPEGETSAEATGGASSSSTAAPKATPTDSKDEPVSMAVEEVEKKKPIPKHCLFTGDTLFSGGHGALFEGSAQDMVRNFCLILTHVSRNTLLFPGHEYTSTLLESQLSSALGSGGSGSVGAAFPNPMDYFKIVVSHYKAAHRRAMNTAVERIPSVPVHLSEEIAISAQFREVNNRRTKLVKLLKSLQIESDKRIRMILKKRLELQIRSQIEGEKKAKQKEKEEQERCQIYEIKEETEGEVLSPKGIFEDKEDKQHIESGTSLVPSKSVRIEQSPDKKEVSDIVAKSKKTKPKLPKRSYICTHESLENKCNFILFPEEEWRQIKETIAGLEKLLDSVQGEVKKQLEAQITRLKKQCGEIESSTSKSLICDEEIDEPYYGDLIRAVSGGFSC